MEPVFENEHFLVIDKRAGYLSVPSRMGVKDARLCELVEWSKLKGILSPVHRLDEEVTGLLMFAKSKDAHRAANLWFENRNVKKTYEALTECKEGSFPDEGADFLWKSKLLRGKKRAYEKPFGKLAVTRAIFQNKRQISDKVLGYWKLLPETGRAHQLRYELFKHGFPVWGDALYGAVLQHSDGNTIGLRATHLSLQECENHREFGLPDELKVSSL